MRKPAATLPPRLRYDPKPAKPIKPVSAEKVNGTDQCDRCLKRYLETLKECPNCGEPNPEIFKNPFSHSRPKYEDD